MGRRIDADAVFVGTDALLPGEHLFVYSADIYIVCLPERVTTIHRLLEQLLEHYARIQVHLGKTQVWNRGGHVRPGCQAGSSHFLLEIPVVV